MLTHTCYPDTQEAKVGGLWSKTGLGKNMSPYLQNELKAKGWGYDLGGREVAMRCKALISITGT
jgi:hypothetical protein